LGFGLGLQNELIDAVAKKDNERQKKHITATQYSYDLKAWLTNPNIRHQIQYALK